jgi:hypothetical protein
MEQEPAHRFAGESIIGPKVRNFLSNEDTGKQACFELAPGFFILRASVLRLRFHAAVSFLIGSMPGIPGGNPWGIKPDFRITGYREREEEKY